MKIYTMFLQGPKCIPCCGVDHFSIHPLLSDMNKLEIFFLLTFSFFFLNKNKNKNYQHRVSVWERDSRSVVRSLEFAKEASVAIVAHPHRADLFSLTNAGRILIWSRRRHEVSVCRLRRGERETRDLFHFLHYTANRSCLTFFRLV